MTSSLVDFSVESENTVLLSFFDGTRRRVRPADLHQYLGKDDLDKVTRALSMRKQFIKKVLPPGAMVLLAGATIGLAYYDSQRIIQMVNDGKTSVTEVANPFTGGQYSGRNQANFNVLEMPQNNVPPRLDNKAANPAAPIIAPPVPAAKENGQKNKNKHSLEISPAHSTSILQKSINKLLR